MGSGTNTVTTNQSQQYTPNQPILGMGQTAGRMATTAAQAPFQMPVAPVAPFTPFQQLGFGETLGAQGMAQPYFGAATNYLQGSAAPITGQDVANYYNPMAANVFGQMQNIFGQQMRETTGQATQQAGGVGADRIGVAQANLANQQGLAAGQTASQLYQQALQAAEQQKQMMAGAGYGIGQMGPAAQGAQLQGIQALLGAGGQQQQLAQALMNAQYQNQLAQIAYPFQTAQYLAGITGGLAPAMGGKTAGQATTTYPSPSPFAQLLGGLTAGAGLFGGMGGFGGGNSPFYSGSNFTGASAVGAGASMNPWQAFGSGAPLSYNYVPGIGTSPMYGQSGGRVIDIKPMLEPGDLRTALERSVNLTRGAGASGYEEADPDAIAHGVMSGKVRVLNPFGRQEGGEVGDYGKLVEKENIQRLGNIFPAAEAGNPLAATVMHDVGYQDGGDVPVPTFPGSSPPRIGGPTPIPTMQLQPGAGKSGPWGQWIMGLGVHQPQQGQQSQSGTSQALSTAMQVLPMLAMMQEGGPVYPDSLPAPFAGPALPNIPPEPTPAMQQPIPFGPKDQSQIAGDIPLPRPRPVEATDPFGARPVPTTTMPAAQVPSDLISGDVSAAAVDAGAGPTGWAPGSAVVDSADPRVAAVERQIRRGLSGQGPGVGGPYQGPRGAGGDYTQMPFGGTYQRPTGLQAGSPWMALIRAGATMMATPGNIGTVIGRGLGAGVTELDSDEKINQKAAQLQQQAQMHLMREQRLQEREEAQQHYWAEREARGREREDRLTEQQEMRGYGPPPKFSDYQKLVAEDPRYMGKDPRELWQKALTDWQNVARGRNAPPPPAASPQTPPRPPGVPDDAGYSPSTKKWYMPDGTPVS